MIVFVHGNALTVHGPALSGIGFNGSDFNHTVVDAKLGHILQSRLLEDGLGYEDALGVA